MKNDLAYLVDQYLNEEMVRQIGIIDYACVSRLKISLRADRPSFTTDSGF